MISQEILLKSVAKLMAMPFYPNEPLVKVALLDELPDIAENDEQLAWLIRRVTQLYTQWPGLSEIHAVYCSKFKPRDGVEVRSGIYLEGIPSERPNPPLLALPANPRIGAEVQKAAKSKEMPRVGRKAEGEGLS